MVCISTENLNQVSFCPFTLQEVSVLLELTLGHLRYRLTNVPPQPNSPPDYVLPTSHTTEPQGANPLGVFMLNSRNGGLWPLPRTRK